MSSIKLGPYGTLQTYLSTELNSLADGANKLGGEIDNASDLELFMDVEIALAAFTPGTSGFIQIFKLASVDGTSFGDGSDSVDPPAGTPVYAHSLVSGASAKRCVIERIPLSPGKQKLLFENRAGAALAGSGNTVKYRVYGYQSA